MQGWMLCLSVRGSSTRGVGHPTLLLRRCSPLHQSPSHPRSSAPPLRRATGKLLPLIRPDLAGVPREYIDRMCSGKRCSCVFIHVKPPPFVFPSLPFFLRFLL